MKKLIISIAATVMMVSTCQTLAEDSKPIATQLGEAMQPVGKALSDRISKTMTEYMAGSEGPLGEAARKNLAQDARREALRTRGERRSMRDCIKPNSVIDDDVKECMEGTRVRTW